MAVSSEGVIGEGNWPRRSVEIRQGIQRWWQRFFGPSETTLVSPALDVIMAGGAAIAIFAVFFYLIPETSVPGWAMALWYASFIINYPHFIASYQLMYGDARAGFFDFKNHRKFAVKLWWAGVIVPVLLVTYFLFALSSGNLVQMGFLAQAMFFFVGWHYIKQIYGCVIVLSAAKKVFYNKVEQYSLLAPLYLLWAVSFVHSNVSPGPQVYQQIAYPLLGISPLVLHYAWLLCLVASAWMVAVFIKKYWRERVLPPWSALAALVSIYLWFSPILAHPMYFAIIPLLHSMQYLLFVTAYKRNSLVATERVEEAKRGNLLRSLNRMGAGLFVLLPTLFIGWAIFSPYVRLPETIVAEWYRLLGQGSMGAWAIFLLGFSGLSIMLVVLQKLPTQSATASFGRFFFLTFFFGVTAFCLLPVLLDVVAQAGKLPGMLSYPVGFGGALYMFFITIFINIHHYFIDNVIWKRDNPYVRAHLLPHSPTTK